MARGAGFGPADTNCWHEAAASAMTAKMPIRLLTSLGILLPALGDHATPGVTETGVPGVNRAENSRTRVVAALASEKRAKRLRNFTFSWCNS